MIRVFILLSLLSSYAMAAARSDEEPGAERASQLRDYIQKEKPSFKERENQKQDLLGELDSLNSDQNKIRERISSIQSNQQELTMALDNLSLEFQKQKEMETFERQRLLLLLKVVYKIKRDGVFRFLVYSEGVGKLAGRIRVLYRALRSHTQMAKALQERAVRLAESEKKLKLANDQMQTVLGELGEQQALLQDFLRKKKDILRVVNRKQNSYQLALKEYKQISSQLSALFDDFESQRDSPESSLPGRGSLPLPLAMGHIVKNFGRSVNPQFGTITYQKGLEIEADQDTPVRAVLSGTVEFDGWVKGLGNVIILHHGGGFYSLSAHLFKSLKARGTRVEQGEIIGSVGDTGNNDKSSLYFELRNNSKAIDPVLYFSQKAMQNLG